MSKDLPLLAVVTGRPGAGKTTLAHALARAIHCPAICRDELKEGYVRSVGTVDLDHSEAARQVYEAFFSTIEGLLAKRVSLVAEAAFQHHVWSPQLESLSAIADIRLVLCATPPALAFRRMQERYQSELWRQDYHPLPGGHQGAHEIYDPPRIEEPSLTVDTSEGYRPSFESILEFLRPR